MKTYLKEACKRGLMAAVGGPLIVAIVYWILGATGTVASLSPKQIAFEILCSALLAFIAAGCSVIYTIERLPLFHATLIHALVLYADYIGFYLLCGWLTSALTPILIFTLCYFSGYAIIWLCVYLSIRRKIHQLNTALQK